MKTTKETSYDDMPGRAQTDSIKWNPELIRKWCGACYEDTLSFWVADMDFACPRPVTEAVQRVAGQRIYGYSDMTGSYYDAVCGWYRRRFGLTVPREWICHCSGIVPAINFILQMTCGSGDKVIIQPPVYYPFVQAVRNNHIGLLENELICENGFYRMNLEQLEQMAADPAARVMILCSPHNPVGRVWSRQELQSVVDICARHGVLLVSDEIHCDIVYGGRRHVPALAFPQILDNLILCSSPSKTFNMAGLQMSNIIIPGGTLRKRFLEKMSSCGILLPNIFGVAAVQAAYNECEPWLDDTLEYLEGNIAFLADYLAREMPLVGFAEPEGTYLAWLDFGRIADWKRREELIADRAHVALDHGYVFGKSGENFERINFACPRRLLAEGLERIKNAME